MYRLASPCKLQSTDWIKPGKVAWDWWNNWNIWGVPFVPESTLKPINIISTLPPNSGWNM
jgi:hypothetical protein